jgi:hypothetical protein
MATDTSSGLVAGRAASRRRLIRGSLLSLAGVVALGVLEIFSDAVRDWSGDHPVVTALITGVIVILFTALFTEGRARQRERMRTLPLALETNVALGDAGLDAAETVAWAYEHTRTKYDLEILAAKLPNRPEPSSPLPQLTDTIKAAKETFIRTQDRWRGVAPFEDIAPALDYCRTADEKMEGLLKRIAMITETQRITRTGALSGSLAGQPDSEISESDWETLAGWIGLLIDDGVLLAEIAKQADAEYIETEMAGDDSAISALRTSRKALAENRDTDKSNLESLVKRRKGLDRTAWLDEGASGSTTPPSREPPERPPDHVAEQPRGMTEDAADDTDVLISYRRDELEHLRTRLDRADNKASGVITATLAVGTIAATGFAALKPPTEWWMWVLVGIGGLLLLTALLLALAVRDTSDSQNTIGTFVSGFMRLTLIGKPIARHMKRIVDARDQLRQIDNEPLEVDANASTTSQAIQATLAKRIALTAKLRDLLNEDAQVATVTLAGGVILLALAAAAILAEL